LKGGTESTAVYWVFRIVIIVLLIAVTAGTVANVVERSIIQIEASGEAYKAQAIAYSLTYTGDERGEIEDLGSKHDPVPLEDIGNEFLRVDDDMEARIHALYGDDDQWCMLDYPGLAPPYYDGVKPYFIRYEDADTCSLDESESDFDHLILEAGLSEFASIYNDPSEDQDSLVSGIKVFEVTP